MTKLLIAAALALSVVACAPGENGNIGGNSEAERAYGKNFYQPNPGTAAVYIIRDDPSQNPTALSFVMGQQPVGSLSGLTWTRLDLKPSLYDFRAYGSEGSSTELIVTTNAGQSRFFLIEAKPPGNAELQEIPQAEGRRLVRKGQVVGNYLSVEPQ